MCPVHYAAVKEPEKGANREANPDSGEEAMRTELDHKDLCTLCGKVDTVAEVHDIGNHIVTICTPCDEDFHIFVQKNRRDRRSQEDAE